MQTSAARILVLGFAGALAFAATTAQAMSGECFWRQLSPETRDALIQGYLRNGPRVLEQVIISDRELRDIDGNCAGESSEGELKDRLLTAVVLEHGAAGYLEQRLGWRDEDIQAAWERMLPHQLAALRDGAEAVLRGEMPPDDLNEPLRAFLGGVPGGDEPANADQAMGYLTSRAMREAIERRE